MMNFYKTFNMYINYYYNVIVLEYKSNKEKINQQHTTLEETHKNIKDNNIQLGNLIFYNFDIPAIKKKLKKEIYKISI